MTTSPLQNHFAHLLSDASQRRLHAELSDVRANEAMGIVRHLLHTLY